MNTTDSSIGILSILRNFFPHNPTTCQEDAMNSFEKLLSKNSDNKVMILKGYAGTGKTTLIKSLADSASALGKKVVLLSPTGRGAKVITDISKHNAYTIHKHIYNFELKTNGSALFKIAFNKFSNTLFIVDEASMIYGGRADINNNNFFSSDNGLLEDLFQYINSNTGNKLVLIGDPAQLPPVNYSKSPALDEAYIEHIIDEKPEALTMREIVRQEKGSGILHNATRIREFIEKNNIDWPEMITDDFDDVLKPESYHMQEMITDAFSQKKSDAVVITVSNKFANKYNSFIRANIYNRENEIEGGDIVMAVKNNYFWLSDENKDFIANGEIMKVRSIRNVEERYGLKFADAEVQFVYMKGEPIVELKILLDVLNSDSASLSHSQFMDLWNSVLEETGGRKTKKLSRELLRENPYINALQVKFAWALTCHKAQGGQWDTVFLDSEFLLKKPADISGLRWLYTAITRAKSKLVLMR